MFCFSTLCCTTGKLRCHISSIWGWRLLVIKLYKDSKRRKKSKYWESFPSTSQEVALHFFQLKEVSCRRLLLKPISPIYLLTLANKWFCVGILLILVCDKQCISLIQCNTLSLPTYFSSMIFQFYIFTSLPRSILNPLHSCQWTTSLSHFSVKFLCGCLTLQTFLRRAGRHVIQLPMYVVTTPWKVRNKFSVLPKLFHIPLKSKWVCLKVHRKTVPAEWDEDLLLAIPLSHGVQLTATRLFCPPAL